MSVVEVKSDELNKIDANFEALSPSLQKSIKKIIEKANFKQYNVVIKDLSTRGDNFLGKLYEIDIINLESEKEINVFMKEKLILKKAEVLNAEQLYSNEEFIYKEFSKIITSLQDQANVPPGERLKMAKAYDETSNEAIILENLHKKGFNVYGKTETVPLKFMELGVKELAKFHALSFVIENKIPEYFNEKIKTLKNPFNFDEEWKKMMRNICRYVANLYDDETKIKIEYFVPVLLEKVPKYFEDRTNKCILSHGDYKKNNIMVRIINGEPVEVVPVDYQLIDYGCPIRDLLMFLFSGTDQEFRRKHLNNLKELYFETLSRFLKYFDMDVEIVYPKKDFEKLYTEWLDFGLMIVLSFSIVIFAPETGVDFGNMSLTEIPFCPDKNFDKILRELVDDFVQWGYL